MKHSYYDVNQYVLENTATGYYYSRGKNNPIEFNKMPVLGSGGLNATGLDIGNFIIALLQKGNYEGNFILSEKSASDMQERHFSAGQFTNGICYSFFERIFNGYRVLEHGGAELGFTSDLKLIPETGIGYFISTNADPYSEGSEEFERQLFYQFMKRFFPTNREGLVQYPVYLPAENELKKFEGNYMLTRNPLNSLGKVLALLAYDELKVDTAKDQLRLSLGDWTGKFNMISPNEFVNKDTGQVIAFVSGENSQIEYISFGGYSTYTKIPWYKTKNLHLMLFFILILSFCINLFILPIVLFKNRTKNNKMVQRTGVIAFVISSINVGFVISLFLYYSSKGLTEILSNIKSPFIVFLLTMPLISLFLLLFYFIFIYKSLVKRTFHTLYRIYFLMFLLCSIAYLLLLNYWCLLGYRY